MKETCHSEHVECEGEVSVIQYSGSGRKLKSHSPIQTRHVSVKYEQREADMCVCVHANAESRMKIWVLLLFLIALVYQQYKLICLEKRYNEVMELLVITESNVQTLNADAVSTSGKITGLSSSLSEVEQNLSTLTEGVEVIETTVVATQNTTKNMEGNLREVYVALDTAEGNIDELRNKSGMWPDDSFCMLANDGCPEGFTEQKGYIRAIRTYSANGVYIATSYFGNSSIRCHGNCGQYSPYNADITIVSCCK